MNAPEDIEAWIAERKKRFPTANRVADKKTKLEEAIARGQLPLDDNPRFPKRPRLEEPHHRGNRGRGRGRGRGRNRPPTGRDETATPKVSTAPVQTASGPSSLQSVLPARPLAPVPSEDCDSSDSDNAPPETLPTKIMNTAVPEPSHPLETPGDAENLQSKHPTREKLVESKRPTVRQPRGPPPVQFGQNTSLLRNVRSFACDVDIR